MTVIKILEILVIPNWKLELGHVWSRIILEEFRNFLHTFHRNKYQTRFHIKYFKFTLYDIMFYKLFLMFIKNKV